MHKFDQTDQNPHQPPAKGQSQGTGNYQKFDENDPEYKYAAAKERKKNWSIIIKIIAIIMMIVGAISLIIGVWNLLGSLATFGTRPGANYSEANGHMTGLSALLSSVIDVITPALVVYQGWLSYKTSNLDSMVTNMLQYIIYFALLHFVLRGIQLVIIGLFTMSHQPRGGFNTDNGDSVDMATVLITVLGVTAACSCCFLCYCCGSIYGLHFFYKDAVNDYETAQKNLNTGTPAPQMDYAHMKNDMV